MIQVLPYNSFAAEYRPTNERRQEMLMRHQIKWLWDNLDAKYHKRHIFALFLAAFTSVVLLINPALTKRLVDDVIMAQNP